MYCVSVNRLLKVVSHYDLSVLSISVMGFQQNKFGWGVGGVRSIQFIFEVLELFKLCKAPYMLLVFTKCNTID